MNPLGVSRGGAARRLTTETVSSLFLADSRKQRGAKGYERLAETKKKRKTKASLSVCMCVCVCDFARVGPRVEGERTSERRLT